MNDRGARRDDPHRGQRLAEGGAPLTRAKAAMIMLHGRGATAESMLALADVLAQPEVAYFAPRGAGHSWYPHPFTAPTQSNEPWLSSALQVIESLLAHLGEGGFPADRVVLLGFSQGACLALEYAARHGRRYGGVIGLSGGLIGPDGTPRDYPGSLAGTPVFLGCGDADPHIPLARVHHAAEVLRRLGGAVTERIYPDMGHVINEDEIRFIRGLLAARVNEPFGHRATPSQYIRATTAC